MHIFSTDYLAIDDAPPPLSTLLTLLSHVLHGDPLTVTGGPPERHCCHQPDIVAAIFLTVSQPLAPFRRDSVQQVRHETRFNLVPSPLVESPLFTGT